MFNSDPDKLTALRNTRYLGSHPSQRGQIDKVDIVFTKKVIRLRANRGQSNVAIPWEAVNSLTADDLETIQRTISTLDVVLLGPLAWLTRDKTISSYLVIGVDDGEWIFAVPHLSQIELRAGLGPLQPFVSGQPGRDLAEGSGGVLPPWQPQPEKDPNPQDIRQSPADRLREITKLHRSGLLTDAEYEAKRAQLIEEL